MTRSLRGSAARRADVLASSPAILRRMPLRRGAATLMRRASRTLESSTRHLLAPQRRRSTLTPLLELHAEAGAPEGALYAGGEPADRLSGIPPAVIERQPETEPRPAPALALTTTVMAFAVVAAALQIAL